MAHFARLDDDNKVIAVEVINNDALDLQNEEESGIDLLKALYPNTNWKQTSFNGSFRKNFAGIGFTFDSEINAFIPPKPYDSWILNTETARWEAPITKPNEGRWIWDEQSLSWINGETL